MSAVAFEAVDIVFGDKPHAALPLMERGLSREQILAETGQVLGVSNCTLAVEKGQICVLMGLSGSGKSISSSAATSSAPSSSSTKARAATASSARPTPSPAR